MRGAYPKNLTHHAPRTTFNFLLLCGVILFLLAACSAPPVAVATSTSQPITEPSPTNTVASEPSPTAITPPTATPVPTEPVTGETQFDGANALALVAEQTDMGARYPGSAGHLQLREWIADNLTEMGWEVVREEFDYLGFTAQNIYGIANAGKGAPIFIAAHYDTRARADQSSGQEDMPVIGAVDGGSGVAVLLELARTLDLELIENEIRLVFFDVEDNGSGGIAGWDWIAGSRFSAENLDTIPQALILVDMVGQIDQELYFEGNSDPELQAELWQIAADLGYADSFITTQKYNMIDDHVPFAQRGIPAIDIIDFDYPYWHTVEDTIDKMSAESLAEVGLVIEFWLEH